MQEIVIIILIQEHSLRPAASRHVCEALRTWRPAREAQCRPRSRHSQMEEDRPAVTHSGRTAWPEGSIGAAGAYVRQLIQVEEAPGRLPGGGDMSAETWRKSRIWLDG